MKLRCELCEGTLEMSAGGQSAVCVACGLRYSIARLRELVSADAASSENTQIRNVSAASQACDIPVASQEYDIPVASQECDIPDASQACDVSVASQEYDVPVASQERDVPEDRFVRKETSGLLIFQGNHQKDKGFGQLLDASLLYGEPDYPYFSMQVKPVKAGLFGRLELAGKVQSGYLSSYDLVYVNDNPNMCYKAMVGDDKNVCAPGSQVTVSLLGCPANVLKGATFLTDGRNATGLHYQGDIRNYFAGIILRHFPQETAYIQGKCAGVDEPVDFLFVRDGKPVLAIFLLNSNDHKARWRVNCAMEDCKKQGIPNMQFYTDYRNNESYIAQRIGQILG